MPGKDVKKLEKNRLNEQISRNEQLSGGGIKLKVKRLTDTARLPTRGSAQAAGYDLYADLPETVEIPPHSTVMIGTGLAVAVPQGYFGAVFARSGLAARESLRPSNCVGVCDSDYRGEYTVAMHNDGDIPRRIDPGERIAQLVVLPYLAVEFEETEELEETDRGTGGFGSTGR